MPKQRRWLRVLFIAAVLVLAFGLRLRAVSLLPLTSFTCSMCSRRRSRCSRFPRCRMCFSAPVRVSDGVFQSEDSNARQCNLSLART